MNNNLLQSSSVAVLLVNFGGPHNKSSVKDFLYNLFSDRRIINLPCLFRNLLAFLISNLRNKSSLDMYKKVNYISPLLPISFLQKEKLSFLFKKNKINIDIFLGFSYSTPFIEDVLNKIFYLNYKKIIILPLYPQYSFATTGSVEDVIAKFIKKNNTSDKEIVFIKNWHKDDDFIQSYTNLISNILKDLDLRKTEIIFSAHSIPISYIEKGDPYEVQIKETVDLILKKLNWKKKWHISYQSKIGPVKWLEPSTDKVIEEIAARNRNANIVIVPLSFTCEHVETIYEIGVLYKDIANKNGIKTFRRVPALNTDKYFIQALYNQVVNSLDANSIKSIL